jgi:hypothetical protein
MLSLSSTVIRVIQDLNSPCLILVRIKHYDTLPDTPGHKAPDTSEWAAEKIRITRKWLDKIGAPACPTDCDNMEDASILILTVQLMAEAGVGGKETTLPLLALAAANLHR